MSLGDLFSAAFDLASGYVVYRGAAVPALHAAAHRLGPWEGVEPADVEDAAGLARAVALKDLLGYSSHPGPEYLLLQLVSFMRDPGTKGLENAIDLGARPGARLALVRAAKRLDELLATPPEELAEPRPWSRYLQAALLVVLRRRHLLAAYRAHLARAAGCE